MISTLDLPNLRPRLAHFSWDGNPSMVSHLEPMCQNRNVFVSLDSGLILALCLASALTHLVVKALLPYPDVPAPPAPLPQAARLRGEGPRVLRQLQVPRAGRGRPHARHGLHARDREDGGGAHAGLQYWIFQSQIYLVT